MRHRKKGRKLSRSTKQRQTLFKSLIQSLIIHETIKTTEAKAKAIKRLVDKLMVKARKGSLHARRQVLAFLPNKKAVHKLFDDLAPRTKERFSGFTKIVRLGRRRGDNTMIVKIEFVDKKAPVVKNPSTAKSKSSAKQKKSRPAPSKPSAKPKKKS